MLLQNPQLGYALLQAQIVMKIVDPQVAVVSIQLLYIYIYNKTIYTNYKRNMQISVKNFM